MILNNAYFYIFLFNKLPLQVKDKLSLFYSLLSSLIYYVYVTIKKGVNMKYFLIINI